MNVSLRVTEVHMKKSPGAIIFTIFNVLILLFLCISIVFPFVQQIVISFSPPGESDALSLHLLTKHPTLDAYKQIATGSLPNAYFWTVLRTVLGTFLTLLVSVMLAYPLSKRYLLGRKVWVGLIVFTMFFGGGLVPTYLLVRNLHLLNTIWALVLPGMCSAYTIIIVRNFFTSLPAEVEESAYIDGANDIQVFFRIVIPLSAPIIATVALWSMVAQWNSWFDAMIYMTNSKIQVLQILLKSVLESAQNSAMADMTGKVPVSQTEGQLYTSESVKAAILMATTLPILCVYPFLQKYFVKGIMVGAVKG